MWNSEFWLILVVIVIAFFTHRANRKPPGFGT